MSDQHEVAGGVSAGARGPRWRRLLFALCVIGAILLHLAVVWILPWVPDGAVAAVEMVGAAGLLWAWFVAAGSLVAAVVGIAVVLVLRLWGGRCPYPKVVSGGGSGRADAIDHPAEIVTVTDGAGLVCYQSPSAARLLGQVPGFWNGRPLTDLIHGGDEQRLAGILSRSDGDQSTRTRTVALALRRGDGSWLATETSIAFLFEGGRQVGLVLASRDVSTIRPPAHARRGGLRVDDLTGLPDREALLANLSESLRSTTGGQVAVAEIDLDGFAALNETLGPDVGDEVLRQVARALRRCVRPWDIVARVGGDEFAVLVAGPHAERSVARVHDRLRRALDAVVIGDGREVRLGLSAGYAVNDTGTESAEELIRNAELALARARTAHRIDILRFEAPMRVALQSRVRAEQELRAALADRQLELAFQPMVSLADGRILGAEALVRWRHPERGLVSAAEFIPLAEQMRVVHELGLWALRRACRELRDLRMAVPELGSFELAVNVSAHQLGPELVREVASATADAGVASTDLVLEVTESVLACRPDEAAETLARLRALGCRVALDDFGTGYSSLAYLARFPVDLIKIDRTFVAGICDNSQQLALTRTIVALGTALRLRTVAEGVETGEQAELLRALGCDHAQGYRFGYPMPMAELIERIRSEERVGVSGAEPDPVSAGPAGGIPARIVLPDTITLPRDSPDRTVRSF